MAVVETEYYPPRPVRLDLEVAPEDFEKYPDIKALRRERRKELRRRATVLVPVISAAAEVGQGVAIVTGGSVSISIITGSLIASLAAGAVVGIPIAAIFAYYNYKENLQKLKRTDGTSFDPHYAGKIVRRGQRNPANS